VVTRTRTQHLSAFTRSAEWNEQLPNDVELIWHFFCTYMDFHLSPSSNAVAAANDFSKPFSNVFFVKSSPSNSNELPLALKSKREEQKIYSSERFVEDFFIRMVLFQC
jgi:hypothetical protein